jgi:hypothetical protein
MQLFGDLTFLAKLGQKSKLNFWKGTKAEDEDKDKEPKRTGRLKVLTKLYMLAKGMLALMVWACCSTTPALS